MKRGQGISINTVIIAAIALIVLVVVVVIFASRIDFFGQNVASCSAKGGSCGCYETTEKGYEFKSLQEGSCAYTSGCPEGYAVILKTDCNSNKVQGDDLCCIPT